MSVRDIVANYPIDDRAGDACPICQRRLGALEPRVAVLCCVSSICVPCHARILEQSADADGFAECPLCSQEFPLTDTKAHEYLTRHVEADVPVAIELLGGCFLAGGTMGVQRNPREAARLFRRAANSAEIRLFRECAESVRTTPLVSAQAAKLGRHRASVRLALMHMEGDGVSKDMAKAGRYIDAAAAADDPYGLYFSGLFSQEATAHGDFPRAESCWRRAAALGHGPSAAAIGRAYDAGLGVAANAATAATWYARAAALRDDAAGARLHEMFAYVSSWDLRPVGAG